MKCLEDIFVCENKPGRNLSQGNDLKRNARSGTIYIINGEIRIYSL